MAGMSATSTDALAYTGPPDLFAQADVIHPSVGAHVTALMVDTDVRTHLVIRRVPCHITAVDPYGITLHALPPYAHWPARQAWRSAVS